MTSFDARSSRTALVNRTLLMTLMSLSGMLHAAEPGLFQPTDTHRVQRLGDLAVSPNGQWLAYRVSTVDIKADKSLSNLYRVSWDGATRTQLTHRDSGSHSDPKFSPDGQYLAFITARGGDDESEKPEHKSQVWRLNLAGGEAERLTSLPAGVSAFDWSPDGKRLVVVSKDPKPKPPATDKSDNETPPPIVVERYLFKNDREGYLQARYERLYLVDLASGEHSQLTADGAFDSREPQWSPDGKTIVFSSKRGGDPDRHVNSDLYLIKASAGATAKQLTTWEGSDYSPAFSPNGRQIAYLRGGQAKFATYDQNQLAIIAVRGGEPRLPVEALDRNVGAPQWSGDGKSLYFVREDDRLQILSSVSVKGGEVTSLFPAADKAGVTRAFVVGQQGLATLTSYPSSPAEIYRVNDARALTQHNEALRTEFQWASAEPYEATSKDGTRVSAVLLKPPGYRADVAYPTIAWVHGGPTAQDGFEFDATAQVLAAQGYLVVNPNYRGSSGRGKAFSRAIYADWGNLEIQDIHAVMDQLVEDGLADPKRLGIGGWSYGGMNTNYAIATDQRFAAAVSGAAISNALAGYGTDQYIWQYENEIGLPWEADGLAAYMRISKPFFHANRIETPTLFMCGEKDWNVPLINSEQMYQALRSQNVPTQLIIYPGQGHSIAVPSYALDRLVRIVDWYKKYL